MNVCIKSLIAGCSVWVILASAPATAACGNLYGSCTAGNQGLTGLFRSDPNKAAQNVQAFGSLLNPYAPPIEPRIRLEKRENQSTSATAPKLAYAPKPMPRDNNEPHSLPVYMGATSLLVFRSRNKQLSKGGPDVQAILMMRCKAGELNVLLDFPGYPMSNSGDRKTISYKTRSGSGKAGFANSDQMSVVGLWEPMHARKFAREIIRSGVVNIRTKDSENTPITADFSLSGQDAHTAGFSQACGIS